MSTFSGLMDKASGILQNLGIVDRLKFPGKDGDMIYSKNNVCVHTSAPHNVPSASIHCPGYLSIHCQRDDELGVTLILQWLPNGTIERNPGIMNTMSPRLAHNLADSSRRVKLRHLNADSKQKADSSSDDDSSPALESPDLASPISDTEDTLTNSQPNSDTVAEEELQTEYDVKMENDRIIVTTESSPRTKLNVTDRPQTLGTTGQGSLGVPSINVIPHTPTYDRRDSSGASAATSDADVDPDDIEGDGAHSSPYSSADEGPAGGNSLPDTEREAVCALLALYKSNEFLEKSPEEFAQAHNMLLPDGIRPDPDANQVDLNGEVEKPLPVSATSQKIPGLFSVDLGKMRSMRLFYSNPECTCGQLVIASPESQYKILHFHHGGLDKLAQIFEQWTVIRAKSVKMGTPDPFGGHHFAICRAEISKSELHPEEGLYEMVTWDFWRHCINPNGVIDDSLTVKKAIFFGGIEVSLRREAWPFLLMVYPWTSTLEQREQIRNDLFLEYQKIRKKRMKESLKANKWRSAENAVGKDVVRTDRKNPYYEGEENQNLETMRNILLNYAAFCPELGYIQGMSDLLAPILSSIQNEVDSFWCFAGLMQRSIFVSIPSNNNMDKNLEYLRELIKLMLPEFFRYLLDLKGDALELMFSHRWILLCFKREFEEAESLMIWEACWSHYHTAYFHLFICVSIISIYGKDALNQKINHDELLFFFASIAHHMDARIVLKKARGLLHQFCRLETIPCTLAGLCDFQSADEMWDTSYQPQVQCVQMHGDIGNDPCPHLADQ